MKVNRLSVPLMSSSSGKLLPQDLGAPEVLTAVIEDILKETLRLQHIVDGCVDLARHSGCTEVSISSFGPASSEPLIVNALESEAAVKVSVDQIRTTLSDGSIAYGSKPQTSRKPKLAIVGMAGRFPDAADHEKFWNLLEAGLDVHRKVQIHPDVMIYVFMLTTLGLGS